jgi:myo-inositol 2-dehydrogenase/D-chiro-inositol 1-dehydrogenase
VGARHIEAWRHLDVALHGFARSAARRAGVAAAYPEVTWHPSFEELLAAVDVVDVCTPTDAHADLVLRATAAGRHVVCEKPLARTLGEADAMVTASAAAGVQLHVAHVCRYVAGYSAAQQAVTGGDVGDPTVLRLYRGGAAPAWAAWFGDPARSGGVLLDLGIHDIDFACWIAGDVVDVTGTMTGPGRGLAVLTHAAGARSEVTAEWGSASQSFRNSFEITGTAGGLFYDSAHETTGRAADPMVEMLGEFRAAIRGGPVPRITTAEAVAALRVALAAAEDAAEDAADDGTEDAAEDGTEDAADDGTGDAADDGTGDAADWNTT